MKKNIFKFLFGLACDASIVGFVGLIFEICCKQGKVAAIAAWITLVLSDLLIFFAFKKLSKVEDDE